MKGFTHLFLGVILGLSLFALPARTFAQEAIGVQPASPWSFGHGADLPTPTAFESPILIPLRLSLPDAPHYPMGPPNDFTPREILVRSDDAGDKMLTVLGFATIGALGGLVIGRAVERKDISEGREPGAMGQFVLGGLVVGGFVGILILLDDE